MLFKFKSTVAGDLIMLEPNGRRVLEIIGKDPHQAGIILPAQMPAALNALDKAIQEEDEAVEKAKRNANNACTGFNDAENTATYADHGVPLRQRTLPFVELLKKCKQADAEIVWGV
ncbi:MAG TPA: DUF1840 domain-containing protein [Burkholderiaceae bacterium]|nr:DUF1840 domain-containing protein [Burkholderiaceae bacterium]